KRGLPLFILTFDNKKSIEKIYEIKMILNTVIRIEPLRKNTKLISQCKRCQRYNYTHTYCQKDPRCVKCAGKHLIQNCSKSRQTTSKCINCKGAHPANYRGCEVAKELQKKRNMTSNR
ncbi:Nucleic-acid-binding protein from transposon X-element, partial [Harpegnathos saltator]